MFEFFVEGGWRGVAHHLKRQRPALKYLNISIKKFVQNAENSYNFVTSRNIIVTKL